MEADAIADLQFPTSGVSSAIDLVAYPGNGCHRHTVQVMSAPNVTQLTYMVFGSCKKVSENPVFPGDFVDIGDGITNYGTNPVLHILEKLVNSVVIQVIDLSGGPATLRYLGSR